MTANSSTKQNRTFNPRRREDLAWNGRGEFDGNGARHGRWDFPFTDGARCFLTYVADDLEGEFAYWHPNGVVETGTFRAGSRDGKALVYEGDYVVRVETWIQGELHGETRSFDPVAQETTVFTFRRGVLEGPTKVVDDRSNMLKADGYFAAGKKDGEWRWFDAAGEVIKTQRWRSGSIQRAT